MKTTDKNTLKVTSKIQFGIGPKLNTLIGTLLLLSVVLLVFVASNEFKKKALVDIKDYNAKTARALAGEMKAIISGIIKNMDVGGKLIANHNHLPSDLATQMENLLFKNDPDLVTTGVYENKNGKFELTRVVTNSEIKRSTLNGLEYANKIRSLRPIDFMKAAKLETLSVFPSKTPEGQPLLTFAIPKNPINGIATLLIVSDVKQDKFIRAFQKEVASKKAPGLTDPATFLVSEKGVIIAHPNSQRALGEESIADFSIFKNLEENRHLKEGATQFKLAGKELLVAYQKVPNVGWVIAQQPLDVVLAPMKHVIQVSIWMGLIVLSGAFIIGFLFSKKYLTQPIKDLFAATVKVAQGDFSVRVNYSKKDEIGALAKSFGEMCEGLEERDRVKSTFNKFQSKAIAEKLLSGEVHLGGENRKATIFFSDIRSFTAMSEKMEPEKVVEMLNEYMSIMVKIINDHGGVVDKYIGDAIMAIWGAPVSHESDTLNAVTASLKMRQALIEFNKKRMDEGKPRLAIGIGLNTGNVLAGNIGSESEGAEKMEYTVIGDTVNEASRIESLTKEMSSDLLISQATLDDLGETSKNFELEVCPPVKVKGKSKKLIVYKVKGHYVNGEYLSYDDPWKPQTNEDTNLWYVKLSGGKTDGPYTPEDLVNMIINGDISPESKVMEKGSQEWMTLSSAPWFDEQKLSTIIESPPKAA